MYILVIFLGLIGLSIHISSRQTKYKDLKETYLYQRNTTIYVVVLVIILSIVFPVSNESFFRISHPVFWMLILVSFSDVYKTKQRLNKYDSENIKT